MAQKSFDIIINQLYQTPDSQELVRKFLHDLSDAKFETVKTSVYIRHNDEIRVDLSQMFSIGGFLVSSSYMMSLSQLPNMMPSQLIDEIVNKNFGSRVKTRNLSKKTLIDGVYTKSKTVHPFKVHWFRKVQEEHPTRISMAIDRVNSIAEANRVAGLETEAKNQALARKAMDEVRKVLMKWKFVGDEALKEALQEFKIDSILSE